MSEVFSAIKKQTLGSAGIVTAVFGAVTLMLSSMNVNAYDILPESAPARKGKCEFYALYSYQILFVILSVAAIITGIALASKFYKTGQQSDRTLGATFLAVMTLAALSLIVSSMGYAQADSAGKEAEENETFASIKKAQLAFLIISAIVVVIGAVLGGIYYARKGGFARLTSAFSSANTTVRDAFRAL